MDATIGTKCEEKVAPTERSEAHDDPSSRTEAGMSKIIRWILSTVTALFVAVSFIGAGLAVCAVPDTTTRLIAQSTSAADSSPFDREQLVHMAVITKQYTVNIHDRAQLDDAQRDINSGRDASKLGERYSLPQEAVDHLDDVHEVLVRAAIVLAVVALAALLLSVLCALWKGMFLLGDMLVEAGILTIALMATCAIIAVVNFDALFGALHGLLFEAGTWTFSADSLLISMYPQGFWVSMGIVWASVAAVLAIIAIIVGVVLRIRGKRKALKPYPFAQTEYDILYF